MLGRFLFRWRGVIGVLAFAVVFWLARPTFGSCLLGVPLLVLGLAIRFWASGYIGIEGRVREIGARQRIVSGPYRLFRHPLYIGNFLLVVGMLLALRPAVRLAAVVLVGFVIEYAIIVAAEERQLAALGGRGRGQKTSSKEEARMTIEARSTNEEMGEKGDSPSEREDARYSPHFRQGPESFRLSRALVEWRTWVVTGLAWGLGLLKAFITM
ncbi:hypothetical protein JXD38_08945 [candidate division WOR-3 bacterium]|nr:hypothetical protein [candidate division WOR-3 bacterium]